MKVIDTNYGKIRGIVKDNYTTYFGIPYAKAPIGDLRWKEPQPVDNWEGIRDAVNFGNRCWQMQQKKHEGEGIDYNREFYSNPEFMPDMNEDGLFLNIWVPNNSEDKNLPVAFWIHGGAFINGFGSEIEFDGEGFAKRDVILVTINYRLGAFGFLCHPDLNKENSENTCGNYGILDQIAALKWVYQNIKYFGGDSKKITIMGQSAGSMSVQTLLSSPLTKGMIAGAILQSAGGYNTGINRDRLQAEGEELGLMFEKLCGVNGIDELRQIAPEKIMEVVGPLMMESFKSGKGLPFTPVIDGNVLHKGYNEVIEAGDHPDIPYMIGSCGDDIGETPETKENGEKSQLYYGCINWSLKNCELGRAPCYVYYFNRKLLGSDDGAFHSSELWYVFETLGRNWRPKSEQDYVLASQMCTYWCNFIKTGNPNGDELPDWKPCSWENHFVKILDV